MGFSYGDEDLKHSDLSILGNFTSQEVFEICNNLPDKKFGYMFCSPFGQASCNPGELNILRDLLRMLSDPKISLKYLFCSDKNMANTLSLSHKNVKYLPPVSDFEGVFVPFPKRSGLLLIGNNLRTSRNFANQLAGIKLAQQKVKFTVDSYGMIQNAYVFFQDIFHIDNWKNHEDHVTEEEKKRIIASSRLGLQITYSDSFNIAAYESALCHVPCLISESLRWGDGNLKVGRVDNPAAIAETIVTFLQDSADSQIRIGQKFHDDARDTMKLNYQICDSVLRSCL
jgi:hypothetical protein